MATNSGQNIRQFSGSYDNVDGLEHWTPPKENTVKVNSNAAIFEVSDFYNLSIVARNHLGE